MSVAPIMSIIYNPYKGKFEGWYQKRVIVIAGKPNHIKAWAKENGYQCFGPPKNDMSMWADKTKVQLQARITK